MVKKQVQHRLKVRGCVNEVGWVNMWFSKGESEGPNKKYGKGRGSLTLL